MPFKHWLGLRRSPEPAVTALGEVQIELQEYPELERDFGCDQAEAIQQLLATRLRAELSRFDTLHVQKHGSYRLAVRDAEAVDLGKIANRLVELIEGEPVSIQRSLVECRARAQVVPADVPTLTAEAS